MSLLRPYPPALVSLAGTMSRLPALSISVNAPASALRDWGKAGIDGGKRVLAMFRRDRRGYGLDMHLVAVAAMATGRVVL